MSRINITAAAHAVPEQVVTNSQLAEIMDTSDEWIYSRTGIKQRRISKHEGTTDLSAKVIQQLLSQRGITADQLDFIIVATMTPDAVAPSTAASLQGRFNAINAFCLDINVACSGFIYGLNLCRGLLADPHNSCGILIGAETLSRIVNWDDRSTAVLFGDGAGGILIEKSEESAVRPFFLGSHFQTFGELGKGLLVCTFPNRSPFSSSEITVTPFITMQGREIWNFATNGVPMSINKALEQAQLDLADIDYFIIHQANARIIKHVAKKLKVPEDRFLQNVAQYGNTSAASIPILFSEQWQQNCFKTGQRIVFCGFGGGLSIGTQIIQL